MKLLFDSHFLIAIVNNAATPTQARMIDACASAEARYASVASLWEIAIKHRLGKLRLGATLARLPELLDTYGFSILDINRHHALEELRDLPQTKDPFDQLMLAQCQVEGLRFVTTDRALVTHPLAWRAS
jgi:PIN domain nuclease of toxin-antitoxin system